MSMFHAARSASPIGCPNPTAGRAGRNAVGAAHAPTRSAAPTPRSAVAPPRRRLRDRILHLPARADRPREDPVVVLDEPRERAALRDLLHRRLHVAGRVHRPALDDRGLAVPAPPKPEARKPLAKTRLSGRPSLPVLAAAPGTSTAGDPAPAHPADPLDPVD